MDGSPLFEELDYRKTPLGELILRRRKLLSLGNREIHEIILGDEYLMSSLFTEVEQALSRLGIDAAVEAFPDTPLDVVVGGLGLGYTARAALEHTELSSLLVVDYLEPVIEWHEEGKVPLGQELTTEPRCRFVHGDFFRLALGSDEDRSFDPEDPERKFHAILLDIDHSPDKLLNETHGSFYEPKGLKKLASRLHPGGVFAMWSDDPPEQTFFDSLQKAFPVCDSHIVSFYNPLQEKDSASTVYVAH